MSYVEASRALSAARAELERGYWYAIAYLGRYGRQPRSEVEELTIPEANALMREVEKLLIAENKPRGESSFEPDPDTDDVLT